jgi:hypothetical protein
MLRPPERAMLVNPVHAAAAERGLSSFCDRRKRARVHAAATGSGHRLCCSHRQLAMPPLLTKHHVPFGEHPVGYTLVNFDIRKFHMR